MPFEQYVLRWPPSLPGGAMSYVEMEKSNTREILNALNIFALDLNRLAAWSHVLGRYSGNPSRVLPLVIEFVRPIGREALNAPRAIKDKMVYTVSHLAHQTNRVAKTGWSEDELPEDWKIDAKVMRKVAATWRSFLALETALAEIDTDKFRQVTNNYRNRAHHGFEPHLEFGITSFVERDYRKGKGASYDYGGNEPLAISELVDPLVKQHLALTTAFDRYWDLVKETSEIWRAHVAKIKP